MRARRLFLHTACRRSPASRPSFHVCKNICFLSMSAYPSLFYSWPRYPFSSVTVQKLFLLPCFSIFLRLYAQDFQVAIARTSLSGIHHRMRSSHDAIQESFKEDKTFVMHEREPPRIAFELFFRSLLGSAVFVGPETVLCIMRNHRCQEAGRFFKNGIQVAQFSLLSSSAQLRR